jgi:hypothetical protein
MIAAIRSEVLKLRTAWLPWGLLGLTVALTSIERILFDGNAGGTGHTSVPSLATYAGQSQSINIPGELLLLATILGIVVAAGEFRHRTVTNTYLATPNRLTVMTAKAIATAAVGMLFGLASSAAATIIGLSFTTGSGHHLLLSTATIGRYAIGAVLGAAVLSAAGVAVGNPDPLPSWRDNRSLCLGVHNRTGDWRRLRRGPTVSALHRGCLYGWGQARQREDPTAFRGRSTSPRRSCPRDRGRGHEDDPDVGRHLEINFAHYTP